MRANFDSNILYQLQRINRHNDFYDVSAHVTFCVSVTGEIAGASSISVGSLSPVYTGSGGVGQNNIGLVIASNPVDGFCGRIALNGTALVFDDFGNCEFWDGRNSNFYDFVVAGRYYIYRLS